MLDLRVGGSVEEGQGVAGITGRGWLAVADDGGGHGVDWLGARTATRGLAMLAGLAPDDCARVGAAADPLDRRRWFVDPAARLEEACVRLVVDRDDPAALFLALDGLLAKEPWSFMTSAIAVRTDGQRLRGAHVGMGCAWVVRAGAATAEPLVVQHDLATVLARTGRPDPTLPPGALRATALGLGALATVGLGVDPFELELAPGDAVVLGSRSIDVGPAMLAALAAAASDATALVAAVERTTPRLAVAVARASSTGDA